MADINTKYFGSMSYTDKEVLHFKNGLFGFEDMRKYLLIRFVNDASSMLCLQSIEEEALAFVVINPFYYIPDYSPTLSESDIADLKVDDPAQLSVYTICTLQENIPKSTANLKCPLLVNTKRGNIAKQIILEDNDYSFKHLFGMPNLTEGAL